MTNLSTKIHQQLWHNIGSQILTKFGLRFDSHLWLKLWSQINSAKLHFQMRQHLQNIIND